LGVKLGQSSWEGAWIKLYTSKPEPPVGELSPGLYRDPIGSFWGEAGAELLGGGLD